MFSYQEVYPLTIISDRYDGAYSDGAFTAWNLYYNNVPEEIDAGDVECREFWESDHGYIVGKGHTPNEAAEDLIKKVQAIEEALAKLEDSEYDSVIAGLEKWIPYFNGEEEQFIPHPATWLNKRRWESEPPKGKQQNAALKYEQKPIPEGDFNALCVNLMGEGND